ncbi:MAG TPA: hypothetical protein VNE61_14430 [Ktedonobacteraceae bacterium]|nr:hypothetical protein [Ktedonobacteraceae bacterium]
MQNRFVRDAAKHQAFHSDRLLAAQNDQICSFAPRHGEDRRRDKPRRHANFGFDADQFIGVVEQHRRQVTGRLQTASLVELLFSGVQVRRSMASASARTPLANRWRTILNRQRRPSIMCFL